MGDTPLKGGTINFVPDAAKGNKLSVGPSGQIETNGTYSLTTDGKAGAPAGWYKVTIFTDIPGGMSGMGKTGDPVTFNPNPKVGDGNAAGKGNSTTINPKYKDSTKTDLDVEVVVPPASGKYDLKVVR